MITLSNVHVSFNQGQANEVCALKNINLTIDEGEFITIIGSNGAGKSTLLNVIAGSASPVQGDVCIDGRSVLKMKEYQRARYIGRIFQNPLLGTAENMTIEENMSICHRKGRFSLQWALNKQLKHYFAEELASLGIGLEQRMHELVGQLSGGQRQALTLLMIVLSKPKLLLLDEHCAALDPGNAEKVLGLSNAFIHQHQLTSCMITHNMSHAIRYGTRILMLDKGEIIADIKKEEKQNLEVPDLLKLFEKVRHSNLDSDSLLLV